MPDQSSRMRALAGRVAIQARRQAGRSVRFPDNGMYTVYSQGAVYVQKAQALLPVTQAVVAITVPDAPTAVVATRGNQQVSVSFAAPVDNGGTPILMYTAISSPEDITVTGNSSPIIIPGLTNGVAYTFRVQAVNAVGSSPFSAPSAVVIPATIPEPPTDVSGARGDSAITVSFMPPADNGGALIIDYTATAYNGITSASTQITSASPVELSGLTNGTAYTVKVKARNEIGFSTEAAAPTSIIPATVPQPPTLQSITPGDSSVSVIFTAGDNGGSPITNYLYSTNAGSSFTAFNPAQTSSPATITGLTNGTQYIVSLKAVNDVGSSAESDTEIVIPATTPATPTNLVATPSDGTVSIAFTAGADGGSAITNYKYSLDGGAYTAFSPADTASPVIISGLTNGTTYAIRLKAVNSVGDGAESIPVSAKPFGVPAAPTDLSAQNITASSVEITFTAGSDGGSAITNYKYSINDGVSYTSLSPVDTTSPITITGLSGSTTYNIKLRAVNAAGDGTPSPTISVTTEPSNVPSGNSKMIILGDASVSNVKSYITTAQTTLGYGGDLTIDTQQLNVSPSYTGDNLATYDVVIILTNGGLNLNATLGDNLNTFVANGNHLIMMSFCWGNVSAISNFDYGSNSVWVYKGTYGFVSMGTYTIEGVHPITTGLSTSSGLGVQNIPNPITLTSDATTIAAYEDGTSAIAVKTIGSSNLVGFNAYPPGSSTANFYKYVVNAIYWVRGYLS
jgi:hypothetical protein